MMLRWASALALFLLASCQPGGFFKFTVLPGNLVRVELPNIEECIDSLEVRRAGVYDESGTVWRIERRNDWTGCDKSVVIPRRPRGFDETYAAAALTQGEYAATGTAGIYHLGGEFSVPAR